MRARGMARGRSAAGRPGERFPALAPQHAPERLFRPWRAPAPAVEAGRGASGSGRPAGAAGCSGGGAEPGPAPALMRGARMLQGALRVPVRTRLLQAVPCPDGRPCLRGQARACLHAYSLPLSTGVCTRARRAHARPLLLRRRPGNTNVVPLRRTRSAAGLCRARRSAWTQTLPPGTPGHGSGGGLRGPPGGAGARPAREPGSCAAQVPAPALAGNWPLLLPWAFAEAPPSRVPAHPPPPPPRALLLPFTSAALGAWRGPRASGSTSQPSSVHCPQRAGCACHAPWHTMANARVRWQGAAGAGQTALCAAALADPLLVCNAWVSSLGKAEGPL